MILNINKVRVNNHDKVWLYQHGGRCANDVYEDKSGKYVLMSDGWGSEVKKYLPRSSDFEPMVSSDKYRKYNFC